jgi:hypothetical protein
VDLFLFSVSGKTWACRKIGELQPGPNPQHMHLINAITLYVAYTFNRKPLIFCSKFAYEYRLVADIVRNQCRGIASSRAHQVG